MPLDGIEVGGMRYPLGSSADSMPGQTAVPASPAVPESVALVDAVRRLVKTVNSGSDGNVPSPEARRVAADVEAQRPVDEAGRGVEDASTREVKPGGHADGPMVDGYRRVSQAPGGGHNRRPRRRGLALGFAATAVGGLALIGWNQSWIDFDAASALALSDSAGIPGQAKVDTNGSVPDENEGSGSDSSDQASGVSAFVLGPAEGIELMELSVTYTRPVAVDVDDAEGWQDGKTTSDGSMDFREDVTVLVRADVLNVDAEKPAIAVEDVQGSSVKKVTIDLEQLYQQGGITLTVRPESYEDEMLGTGTDGEPVPLLERLLSSDPSDPELIQSLKDAGLLKETEVSTIGLSGKFEDGLPGVIHSANADIINTFLRGENSAHFWDLVEQRLIQVYGLNDANIRYEVIGINTDQQAQEGNTPQAQLYEDTFGGVGDELRLTSDPAQVLVEGWGGSSERV